MFNCGTDHPSSFACAAVIARWMTTHPWKSIQLQCKRKLDRKRMTTHPWHSCYKFLLMLIQYSVHDDVSNLISRSVPSQRTSSMMKSSGTFPNWDSIVKVPPWKPSILKEIPLTEFPILNPVKGFTFYLHTTRAFSCPFSSPVNPSSQTGRPSRKMFPSWDPDPPRSSKPVEDTTTYQRKAQAE